MERRTYLLLGLVRTARDPRTSATMTEANWQRYMADFMVAVRAALPAAEIVHDVLWYKGDTRADIVARARRRRRTSRSRRASTTPSSPRRRDLRAGRRSPAFVERRQAAGQGVILDGHATPPPASPYGLANLLLLDTGPLALGNDLWTAPGRFWTGYDVNSARRPAALPWSGVWRRDFAGGIVLVNEPGMPSRTRLARRRLRGTSTASRARSVTLAAGDRPLCARCRSRADADADRRRPPPPRRAAPTPVRPRCATADPVPPRPAPAPGRRSSNPTASIAGAAEPGRTAVDRHRLAPGRLRPRQAARSAATST